MAKALTRPQFIQRCKERGVAYTYSLWLAYLDHLWSSVTPEYIKNSLDKKPSA